MERNFSKISLGCKASVSSRQICYMRYGYYYSTFSFSFISKDILFAACSALREAARRFLLASHSDLRLLQNCDNESDHMYSDFSLAWICSQNNEAAGLGDFKCLSTSLGGLYPQLTLYLQGVWASPSSPAWICHVSLCPFSVLLSRVRLGNLTQLPFWMHSQRTLLKMWSAAAEKKMCWQFGLFSLFSHTKMTIECHCINLNTWIHQCK